MSKSKKVTIADITPAKLQADARMLLDEVRSGGLECYVARDASARLMSDFYVDYLYSLPGEVPDFSDADCRKILDMMEAELLRIA